MPTISTNKELLNVINDDVKNVKQLIEQSKIAIRNNRRDINNKFKELLKSKDISEDQERKSQELVQKITNEYIAQIDNIFKQKEKN